MPRNGRSCDSIYFECITQNRNFPICINTSDLSYKLLSYAYPSGRADASSWHASCHLFRSSSTAHLWKDGNQSVLQRNMRGDRAVRPVYFMRFPILLDINRVKIALLAHTAFHNANVAVQITAYRRVFSATAG